MSKVCVGRNPMTLVAGARGGASSYGHNYVGPSRGDSTEVPQILDLIP